MFYQKPALILENSAEIYNSKKQKPESVWT